MGKLLLVDDDQINGTLLQKRLIKRGFECDYVQSGTDCLKAVAEGDYSLILLDIMMPDMSGTEVLEQLRKSKKAVELPVIMVTAKDETSDIVDALKKEANDYLTKPVNIDVAIARINTQLQVLHLVQESLTSKQIATVNAMVTTLNHEINNPLAIVVGNLSILQSKLADDSPHLERIHKAMGALDRITEIVKKIEEISTHESNMEEVTYSGKVNMYKLK